MVKTHPSDGSVEPVGSLVTMGFKSVPFRLFFPPFPFPFAAEAATLAICFPLLRTALVRSTLSIVGVGISWKRGEIVRDRAGQGRAVQCGERGWRAIAIAMALNESRQLDRDQNRRNRNVNRGQYKKD